MKRGHYGSGSISPSGKDSWRIRYRINGQRFSKTVAGSRTEAARELRNQLKAGDDGAHTAPNRTTLEAWSKAWLELKGRSAEGQSRDRYESALNTHVLPLLGPRPLQKITPTDLDRLFGDLAVKLAPRSLYFVFVVVKSCLKTAVKKGLLSHNPADKAERPATDDTSAGTVLDGEQLGTLVQGFRDTSIYEIVATAAFTGARRGETLALRWTDVDFTLKTISITRSIERTKDYGRRVKGPKSARGRRTITIDDGLATLLKSHKERHLRLVAGIPEGVDVDLSLVKLPDGALMFPALRGSSLTQLQSPETITAAFALHAARLGFPDMRFHDLRASHGTALLDRGVSVHTVAERLGHDPAMLLRVYAKRTKKSDTAAADIIGAMTRGVL